MTLSTGGRSTPPRFGTGPFIARRSTKKESYLQPRTDDPSRPTPTAKWNRLRQKSTGIVTASKERYIFNLVGGKGATHFDGVSAYDVYKAQKNPQLSLCTGPGLKHRSGPLLVVWLRELPHRPAEVFRLV